MYSAGFNRAFGEERPGPVPLIPTPLCHPQPRGCQPAMTESREERKNGIKRELLRGMALRLGEKEEENEEDKDLVKRAARGSEGERDLKGSKKVLVRCSRLNSGMVQKCVNKALKPKLLEAIKHYFNGM